MNSAADSNSSNSPRSQTKMGAPCDWQLTKQKVAQRGKYLLETGQWSDCKFLVGQEPHQQVLEGHMLILAMSSPVFEAMFFGGMAEKNAPIPIRDVQPEAFKALLEYIYTDHVDLGSFELACELCYCAKKYMLPFLVEECTKFLWSDLSPKKACRAYEFAKLFEEPILMEKCLQIICTETNEVLKESSWEEVELGTLMTVFAQNELQINSELELFNAVERWAKAECARKSLDAADTKSLKSVVGSALSKIRFLSLSPQEFADGPGRSPLLTQDEIFVILMNLLCSGNKAPMPEGFSTETTGRAKPKKQFTFGTPKVRGIDSSFTWTNGPCVSFGAPSTSLKDHERNWPSSLINFQNKCEQVNCKYSMNSNEGNNPNEISRPRRNQDEGERNPSAMNSWPPLADSLIRDGPKYYCLRPMIQQTDCLNSNVLDCSVTFSVDKNISVLGVQVPAQILGAANSLNQARETTYTEILYAHLLDSDGSRLTYTHFTTKVNVGDLVEITFNRPVFIQKHKIYRVGVVFNTAGWYPMGVCTQRMACDNVFFSFGVGNSADSIRDGLVRAIVFTYNSN